MSTPIHCAPTRNFHIGELVAAATLATLSFGAHSQAEKERARAESLGPQHPAYEEARLREALPSGLAKTMAGTALVAAAMGVTGLRSCSKRPK